MNIGMCPGGLLPLPQHFLRDFRWHIQIQHQIRLWQSQQPVFQIEQPVQKCLPLPLRQLGRLMHRVGGGIAVRDHQPAAFVKCAPVLLIGGIAVHGKHQ